uniref:Uncharacterized protein n=1 Tax=Arundo donax TaxID=35708 RepID=A0A0A8ZK83_ARUDO
MILNRSVACLSIMLHTTMYKGLFAQQLVQINRNLLV